MAIYDLRCEKCDHQFEKFVTGFLEEQDKQCPECGSREVSQKFTSFFGGRSTGFEGGGCSSPPGGSFG